VNGGSSAPVTLGLAAAATWERRILPAAWRPSALTSMEWSSAGSLSVGCLLALVLFTGNDAASAKLAPVCTGRHRRRHWVILLYRALAGGQMSVAAPVSAVLAAIIPVFVSATMQGCQAP